MKWYQEKTYRMAIITMAIIGVVMTAGVSIVDGEFSPEAFILFGAGIVVTTLGQIISYKR